MEKFMSFELIKLLVKKNMRVFNTEQARVLAEEIGLNPDTIVDRLRKLKKKGMIDPLMK